MLKDEREREDRGDRERDRKEKKEPGNTQIRMKHRMQCESNCLHSSEACHYVCFAPVPFQSSYTMAESFNRLARVGEFVGFAEQQAR